jgi:surface protein
MKLMFFSSEFNNNINNWDVSNVTDMEAMFYESKFNKDIFNWDVSNVTNMTCMFVNSEFNKNISKWNINSNCDISAMFDDNFKNSYKPKKIQLNEAFDFDSVNKQKKSLNAIDILKKEQLPIIFEHIDKREHLNDQDYSILTSFTGIYKVSDHNVLKSDHDVLKDLIYYFTV